MTPPSRTPAERLALIAELADWLYAHTESWEEGYGEAHANPVGADIAYLFGAIARDRTIVLDPGRNALWALLTDHLGEQGDDRLPSGHPVWGYISIEAGG